MLQYAMAGQCVAGERARRSAICNAYHYRSAYFQIFPKIIKESFTKKEIMQKYMVFIIRLACFYY